MASIRPARLILFQCLVCTVTLPPVLPYALLKQLIKGMTARFEPEKYKDTYQDTLREIIQAKIEHRELKAPEEKRAEAAVEDLLEQLKRSLELTN